MGFNEFGQSVFGIVIISIAFLVVFGGFQNQDLYDEFLPNGVTGPNDVNNYNTGITVSSTVDPYATVTSPNPTQDNNPLFNFVANDIPNFLNAFAKTAAATIDALFYIAVPVEIIYIFAVLVGVTMTLFGIYFVGTIALGLLGRFN